MNHPLGALTVAELKALLAEVPKSGIKKIYYVNTSDSHPGFMASLELTEKTQIHNYGLMGIRYLKYLRPMSSWWADYVGGYDDGYGYGTCGVDFCEMELGKYHVFRNYWFAYAARLKAHK